MVQKQCLTDWWKKTKRRAEKEIHQKGRKNASKGEHGEGGDFRQNVKNKVSEGHKGTIIHFSNLVIY